MNILKPEDVEKFKYQAELERAKKIPQFVYDIFNKLISEKYCETARSAVINLNTVKELVRKNHPEDEIWWYDVETMYREHGWLVTFTKGAYYEENSQEYTFKKIR